MSETSEYRKGYNAGFERGVSQTTSEIERLRSDLTWALHQIESPDVPRATIDEVARLRATWRLERSGGKERQAHGYAPGGDMETD